MEEKIVGLGPATCSLLAPAFVVVAEGVNKAGLVNTLAFQCRSVLLTDRSGASCSVFPRIQRRRSVGT